WWLGGAALGVIAATVGGKEIARAVLPRPDLVRPSGRPQPPAFPAATAAHPEQTPQSLPTSAKAF
ncbi:hypothetical protein ACWD44_30735, partial [Streptomyces albidoflavus]